MSIDDTRAIGAWQHSHVGHDADNGPSGQKGNPAMPVFSSAVSTRTGGAIDLAPYREFLAKFEPGTAVTVPLEAGERPRIVARAFNAVATEQGKRLRRLRTNSDAEFRFVVVRPGRRGGLTMEQIEARVAKAKATREANKARRLGQ